MSQSDDTFGRVWLIDYGAGNLTSVRKALAAVGASVSIPRAPDQLEEAQTIIVPGVGNFRATGALDHSWRSAILRVIDRGGALLGICLGLQWLFEGSDEAPDLPGLGLIPGRCTRLKADLQDDERASGTLVLKVPHVGWNSLLLRGAASSVLATVPSGAQAYFTHSYAAPVTAECVATTTHGLPFASAVERGRLAGVQFHPEKSGRVGLTVLTNFLRMASHHALQTNHRLP